MKRKDLSIRNPSLTLPTLYNNSLSGLNYSLSLPLSLIIALTERHINHLTFPSQLSKPYLIVMSYFTKNVQEKILATLSLQQILITTVSLALQMHKSVNTV